MTVAGVGGPLLLPPGASVQRWSRVNRGFVDVPRDGGGGAVLGPSDLISVHVGPTCRSIAWLAPVADRVVRLVASEGEITEGRSLLSQMVRLRTLLLKGESWGDEHVARLPPSVRELSLFATRASGLGLRPLAEGQLHSLSVSTHRGPRPFTDDDILDLLGFGSALRFFCPWGTDVTDASLESIAAISGLQTLVLAHSRVDGSGFDHLLQAQDLRALRLDGTTIAPGALAVLGAHPTLERVGLIGAILESPQDVRALLVAPKLASVVLKGDELPPEDVQWLRAHLARRRSS